MMKHTMRCLLTALLLTAIMTFAAAEGLFGLYELTAPRGVKCEEGETSATFVYGKTRVVAMVINRIPDEDAENSLPVLMLQFDPEAVFGESLPLREGFAGMKAVSADRFGEGVDQVTAMVVHQGDLLILSGYNTDGDAGRVHELIDALLREACVGGEPILAVEAIVSEETQE